MKREIESKINELLQLDAKPNGNGGNKISLSDLNNKIKDINDDLNQLKRRSDIAIKQLHIATKELEKAKNERDVLQDDFENTKNYTMDEIFDKAEKARNGYTNVTNKEFDYNDARRNLKEANGKLYQSELQLKLCIGIRNKLFTTA